MFKSIKKFICNLFNIKACKCDDDVVTEVATLTISKPTHCRIHTRFKSSCLECITITN
mgnify:CR=1 FL=1